MSAPLKPCPFCGHEPCYFPEDGIPEGCGWWRVGCPSADCEMNPSTMNMPTKEEAAKVWNRRASSNRPGKLTSRPHTGRNRAGEKEKKDAK